MIYVVYPITSPIWKAGVIFTYSHAGCGSFATTMDLSLNKESLLLAWEHAKETCLTCRFMRIQDQEDDPVTRFIISSKFGKLYMDTSPRRRISCDQGTSRDLGCALRCCPLYSRVTALDELAFHNTVLRLRGECVSDIALNVIGAKRGLSK